MLADEKLEDSDIESAPKLIEAVLQNCRGRVDQWLEPYLRISVERLRRTQKNYLKDLLMEVVHSLTFWMVLSFVGCQELYTFSRAHRQPIIWILDVF